MTKTYTLGELAKLLNAELVGDADISVSGLASLDKASASQVAFFEDAKLADSLSKTQAAAVLISPQLKDHCKTNSLLMEKPRLGFAKLLQLFHSPVLQQGIHSSAVIGEHCEIDPTSWIGPNAVVGNNVVIGKNCYINGNVSIYDGVRLGDRVIIHSGAVLGADGFGYEPNAKGEWIKVPQIGSLVIGDDVEIGAGTTIDCGALDDTVIGNGVKIDNLVMIAHNVKIGDHTVIAGCTGIAGSTTIGKHCLVAGAACIGDHLTIADKVVLMGAAMVNKSISEPGMYSSLTGIHPRAHSHRLGLRFSKLDEMAKKIKQLEREIGEKA